MVRTALAVQDHSTTPSVCQGKMLSQTHYRRCVERTEDLAGGVISQSPEVRDKAKPPEGRDAGWRGEGRDRTQSGQTRNPYGPRRSGPNIGSSSVAACSSASFCRAFDCYSLAFIERSRVNIRRRIAYGHPSGSFGQPLPCPPNPSGFLARCLASKVKMVEREDNEMNDTSDPGEMMTAGYTGANAPHSSFSSSQPPIMLAIIVSHSITTSPLWHLSSFSRTHSKGLIPVPTSPEDVAAATKLLSAAQALEAIPVDIQDQIAGLHSEVLYYMSPEETNISSVPDTPSPLAAVEMDVQASNLIVAEAVTGTAEPHSAAAATDTDGAASAAVVETGGNISYQIAAGTGIGGHSPEALSPAAAHQEPDEQVAPLRVAENEAEAEGRRRTKNQARRDRRKRAMEHRGRQAHT
ncbi:uncharacterized protein MKK02DRAFT_28441 [Dioszegia hungarica]|uniref:Uncharacterized protein n=1 Tax=Dioszegia hungarica TaxID=4972 RepID=A0AA38LRZ5_9TREE|nr:uncharacterized protein MKK02DRAFT_28441 [Dioszegia hungarica]KAI9633645.1 hypothetical protein MKK02DRAFT_28441 [Dioszegia hungarica]